MSNPNIRLIETEDGSSSLYREDIRETYHSFHGARGESLHVFIDHGLSCIDKNPIHVLEIGMGTGLNVFLSALYAEQHQLTVQMTTLEPIPIKKELYSQLNYASSAEEQLLIMEIHACDWGHEKRLSDNFLLIKKEEKLEDHLVTSSKYDIVYFDAFAPSKQPEIWSIENLHKCFETLKKGGILTTYCAQGQFKRNLKSVGFEVESLQGAMGKKEMVRAIKS
jgi:tRNA U34 5-methylaminomethyl-2-thiouridine-forming methyltransferase MnmC